MNKTTLSATKIKCLQSCSWMYWAKYKLKLPEKNNLGAQLGSIAHTVFECLGNPRHKKHYDKCIKSGNIYKCEPIRILIKKYFKKTGISSKDDAVKLNSMIMSGLTYDFFGKENGRPSESYSELEFELNVEDEGKNYKVKGFIDKLFLYKKKTTALIRDFKTSKKAFEGKDAEDNLQDQIYSLAVKKLYPEFLKIKVEFPFLQLMPSKGSEAIVKMENHSNSEMDGFEYFLTEIQKIVDSFEEKDAVKDMAYYKEYPSDKSFSGRLLCGFDDYKGHLKKDGSPRWGCPFKWGFEYYCVRDKDNNIKSTYFLDEYDKISYDEENGDKIFIEKYKGCPAWNKK